MESNQQEIITCRENIISSQSKMFIHSLQPGKDREEQRIDNRESEVLGSPSTARRSGIIGVGAQHNPRRSLKSLLLSCQRKSSNSSVENPDRGQIKELEICQEASEAIMALKRSSSVPHKVSYPLHDAINNGDVKDLGKLFKKKRRIDIDLKDQEGFTPLHRAAQLGITEAVELLVSHGANVNAKNKSNMTPLYYAVQSGNFECASFLIENGADDSDIKDGFIDSKMPDFKGSKLSRSRMSSVHN